MTVSLLLILLMIFSNPTAGILLILIGPLFVGLGAFITPFGAGVFEAF